MGEDYGRSIAPVNVGDELELTIEAVGAKGDGIAKKDGFVLFVPNTQEGQQVKVRVTKVLRKVGFAEVIGEGAAESAVEDAPVEEPTEEPKMPDEEPAPGEEELPGEVEDTEDFGEEEKTE